MSGRDVRRLAARATNMTHEAKRDIVARVAAGADALGATDLWVAKEPFRIATAALEHMSLNARVHVLDNPITNSAADTQTNVTEFLRAGISVIVSIGGDGTNRAIVRAVENARQDPALRDTANAVHLLALSTGTNNVFPVMVEPTIAGMVAALMASGRLRDETLRRRAKVLHISGRRASAKAHELPDVGLIDAVLLKRDHVGNLLPFAADRVERILLTRAEPAAIGMSPIGGLVKRVTAEDDFGLLVQLAPAAGVDTLSFAAPLSPGLFSQVHVRSVTPIPFGVAVPFAGPGVLALDGDRDHKLIDGNALSVEIRRDGPWIVDIENAIRRAVAQGMIAVSGRPPTA
jgi:hypothetical protein